MRCPSDDEDELDESGSSDDEEMAFYSNILLCRAGKKCRHENTHCISLLKGICEQ